MTQPVWLVWIVLAVTLLLSSPAGSAPAEKMVSIDAVPGLSDYLTGRFQLGWRNKRHVFLVRLIDLDETLDGIDEILLSVDKFDPEYCSNAGCIHEVLVRQPDGSLKAVTSFRGYGLEISDTYTNGVRDLVSETSRGNRRLNLSGETSGSRDRNKPGGNLKDVKLAPGLTSSS